MSRVFRRSKFIFFILHPVSNQHLIALCGHSRREMNFHPQLPPEIWTEIFKMLSDMGHPSQENHIKSVRLTCRFFDQLATPLLMSEVTCGPLSSTLVRLAAVAHHPVLSKSINTLVFASRRYQPIGLFTDYHQAVQDSHWRYEADLREFHAMFSHYVQHYQDQIVMERSGELTARLLLSFHTDAKCEQNPNIAERLLLPRQRPSVDSFFGS